MNHGCVYSSVASRKWRSSIGAAVGMHSGGVASGLQLEGIVRVRVRARIRVRVRVRKL